MGFDFLGALSALGKFQSARRQRQLEDQSIADQNEDRAFRREQIARTRQGWAREDAEYPHQQEMQRQKEALALTKARAEASKADNDAFKDVSPVGPFGNAAPLVSGLAGVLGGSMAGAPALDAGISSGVDVTARAPRDPMELPARLHAMSLAESRSQAQMAMEKFRQGERNTRQEDQQAHAVALKMTPGAARAGTGGKAGAKGKKVKFVGSDTPEEAQALIDFDRKRAAELKDSDPIQSDTILNKANRRQLQLDMQLKQAGMAAPSSANPKVPRAQQEAQAAKILEELEKAKAGLRKKPVAPAAVDYNRPMPGRQMLY